MTKHILVTGGVGYIGTHTCIELINSGYEIVVYDNLSNSNIKALHRVEEITQTKITFIEGDILDKILLEKVFSSNLISAVIHFAGLKAVGESVTKPLLYYKNNVSGTINLLEVMKKFAVKNFVFSSSATVYGDPATLPITEDSERSCTNPYGQSKLCVEYILEDLAKSDDSWNIISLRYFNPVGAHKSGLIGEDPNGLPNNLMPYISQVAVGRLNILSIFGNNYDTVDGTGVRDFIHVVDLAKGHTAALDYLKVLKTPVGFAPVNLGTGKGTSVLELVHAFETATGKTVPYKFVDRRPGDIASCYASADKALELFAWKANNTVKDMCVDTWKWQNRNPNGYVRN